MSSHFTMFREEKMSKEHSAGRPRVTKYFVVDDAGEEMLAATGTETAQGDGHYKYTSTPEAEAAFGRLICNNSKEVCDWLDKGIVKSRCTLPPSTPEVDNAARVVEEPRFVDRRQEEFTEPDGRKGVRFYLVEKDTNEEVLAVVGRELGTRDGHYEYHTEPPFDSKGMRHSFRNQRAVLHWLREMMVSTQPQPQPAPSPGRAGEPEAADAGAPEAADAGAPALRPGAGSDVPAHLQPLPVTLLPDIPPAAADERPAAPAVPLPASAGRALEAARGAGVDGAADGDALARELPFLPPMSAAPTLEASASMDMLIMEEAASGGYNLPHLEWIAGGSGSSAGLDLRQMVVHPAPAPPTRADGADGADGGPAASPPPAANAVGAAAADGSRARRAATSMARREAHAFLRNEPPTGEERAVREATERLRSEEVRAVVTGGQADLTTFNTVIADLRRLSATHMNLPLLERTGAVDAVRQIAASSNKYMAELAKRVLSTWGGVLEHQVAVMAALPARSFEGTEALPQIPEPSFAPTVPEAREAESPAQANQGGRRASALTTNSTGSAGTGKPKRASGRRRPKGPTDADDNAVPRAATPGAGGGGSAATTGQAQSGGDDATSPVRRTSKLDTAAALSNARARLATPGEGRAPGAAGAKDAADQQRALAAGSVAKRPVPTPGRSGGTRRRRNRPSDGPGKGYKDCPHCNARIGSPSRTCPFCKKDATTTAHKSAAAKAAAKSGAVASAKAHDVHAAGTSSAHAAAAAAAAAEKGGKARPRKRQAGTAVATAARGAKRQRA